MTQGKNYHLVDVRVVTNGNDARLTTYGEVITNTNLGIIDGNINNGVFNLTITPNGADTTVKFQRSALKS
jgi:hypothetical protein